MSESDLKGSWAILLFGVRRSVRYHNYRRQFFDTLSTWTDFLTIISGGAVVGFAAGTGQTQTVATVVFGALAGLLAALDLVLGFSIKARDHSDLSKRFTRLEQEMTEIGDSPTEGQLHKINTTRLEIESEEPPVKRLLDVWCHNELVRALGHPRSEAYVLGFWQRTFKQFFSFGLDDLKKVDEAK